MAALSTNPARVLSLPGGTLAVGSPADVTVLDLKRARAIDPARFQTKGRNTPFGGWTLTGWPSVTIVGGTVVWQDAAPGKAPRRSAPRQAAARRPAPRARNRKG